MCEVDLCVPGRDLVQSLCCCSQKSLACARAPPGLERDKELLLQSCTTRAPEALDSLGAEEHRTVYSMLGLRVDALPDKRLRVQGAFGEENLVCHHDRTSTR